MRGKVGGSTSFCKMTEKEKRDSRLRRLDEKKERAEIQEILDREKVMRASAPINPYPLIKKKP